jgi:hypothetical protein
MPSTFIDTPFNTILTATSGDAAAIQSALVALQTALSVAVPTPSGFALSGVTWSPAGPAGSPTSGTLIFQWSHT